MRHYKKRAAAVILTACMLMTAMPVQSGDIMKVYAGDNDFSWSTYSKKDASWWTSSEAISYGDEIVAYQLWDGGWRKDMKTETSGSWNKSTIDNNATWGQIRYLAKLYNATKNEKYKTSCLKGIDLLINGQYSNGGWPQVFSDPGTYHAHITFNDSAMVAVLRIMQEVGDGSEDFAFVDSERKEKAKNAVNKGIDCILKCQITVNGTLTAWCQQHDENTLAPASARAYELPSVCTSESSGIVDFLRSLPDEMKAYDDVSKISQERRTGYAWYGSWPANNVKLGIISEPQDDPIVTPSPSPSPSQSQGAHLYVGYFDKDGSYSTVSEAVNAAAQINPTSEEQRVYIHIAPGVYREQIIVNTPYISFINDDPSAEVRLTWYYGIGYKYYSMGSDGYYNAENARNKTSKGEAVRWGSATALKGNADYFRAEYITFENSFNRYVTDEEIADGVEVSGSQSITFQRTKWADVTSKASTERGAAIAVEGDQSEFYKCTFLGSQDTLYVGSASGYFRECHIVGNTDYIFGQGDMIFEDCDLEFSGYSDKAVGGYITAMKSKGKTLFYNCNVTAAGGKNVGSGYFGRPWGAEADVAFVNTKLQYENIITSAGWTKMSNNDPAAAHFKEFGTTAGGNPVNTSGRVQNTVRYSGDGLDVNTYLNGWTPNYLNGKPADSVIVPPEKIKGDINTDGSLDSADILLFQKWMLADSDAEITDSTAADLNEDGKINIADLCMMKSLLLQ